jgi:hypothetical protein
VQVVHADLIPGMVGLRIFQAMPPKIKLKAIAAALTGQGGGRSHVQPIWWT